jgi:16S rRNA (guanine527-N7)-methyltransferase
VSHREVLESELRKFQIDLPVAQKLTLAAYCDELVRWNKKINLTGLTGSDMVRRLVVEPVWIGLELKLSGILADIGSGNGSPAIPLHVACGLRRSHLIEARGKRAAFLRHIITTLKVPAVAVHRARFDEAVTNLGNVDWITLQGVAFTAELIDSMRRIATTTTTIVWITSSGANAGLRPLATHRVPLTGTEVFLFRLDLP